MYCEDNRIIWIMENVCYKKEIRIESIELELGGLGGFKPYINRANHEK